MKLKTNELEKISIALTQTADIDMLQRTAYFIGRIQEKIESELKQYMKSRGALEEKYGEYKTDRDKETYTFKKSHDEQRGYWYNSAGEKAADFEANQNEIYWKAKSSPDFEKYMDELQKLGEAEIEIPLEPIKLSELVTGEGKPISMKPRIMAALLPVFSE